jgi:outer membrane protein assembly factor BamE (lipoprotein component of BamABCDE complex)
MEDVLKKCGTPSLHKNNFTWIYIGGHAEEVAFKDIEIKDRSVIKLIFDENKVLKDKIITHPTKEDYNFDEEVTDLISNTEVKALLKKVHE